MVGGEGGFSTLSGAKVLSLEHQWILVSSAVA